MWASRAAGRRGQGRVPAHSSACHPGGAGGRADLNPIHPPTRETGGADPAAEAKPRPGRQECGLPLPPRLAPVCHRLPDAGATGGRGTGRDSAPVSLPPAPPLNARFPIHRGRADAQAGPTPRCAPLPPALETRRRGSYLSKAAGVCSSGLSLPKKIPLHEASTDF